jgi:hypothetical protein
MKPFERAALYNERYPDRPGLSCNAAGTMVGGCWAIGACYKNPNPLYGAYPYGYLERVHCMFSDALRILHVFSGGLTYMAALDAAASARPDATQYVSVELVDVHGPKRGRYPTWQGNVLDMPTEWSASFDLILADPPYSAADAEKYDCPPPNRRAAMQALRRVTAPAGNLVWLDQVWPMHRKDEWRTWAQIGLVRSTNHRVRLVSIFEAV